MKKPLQLFVLLIVLICFVLACEASPKSKPESLITATSTHIYTETKPVQESPTQTMKPTVKPTENLTKPTESPTEKAIVEPTKEPEKLTLEEIANRKLPAMKKYELVCESISDLRYECVGQNQQGTFSLEIELMDLNGTGGIIRAKCEVATEEIDTLKAFLLSASHFRENKEGIDAGDTWIKYNIDDWKNEDKLSQVQLHVFENRFSGHHYTLGFRMYENTAWANLTVAGDIR